MPEERLEALRLADDDAAVARLLHDEPSGLTEEHHRYLTAEAGRRDGDLVLQLRDIHDGACQIFRWAPRASYGTDIYEAHHMRWLSRGGEDRVSNLVLLCSNHHRAVHRCDAAYDFDWNGFLFGESVELLGDRRHTVAG